VREPEAFLRRVVTRLCLNFLKSSRHQRETYVGTWLPEPIVEAEDEETDNVTLPLMLALERTDRPAAKADLNRCCSTGWLRFVGTNRVNIGENFACRIWSGCCC